MATKSPKKTKKSIEEEEATPMQKIVAPTPFSAPKGVKSKLKRESLEQKKEDLPKIEESSKREEPVRPLSPKREEPPRPTSPRKEEEPRPSSPKREPPSPIKEEPPRPSSPRKDDPPRTPTPKRVTSPKKKERAFSVLQELVLSNNQANKPAVLPKRTILTPTLVVRAPAQTTLPPIELPSTPKSPSILRQARSPLRSPSRVSFGKSESHHAIPHRTSTDYLPEVGIPLSIKTLCIGDLKSIYNKLSQYDTWEHCEKALESQSRCGDYCVIFGMSQPKYTLKASGTGWELKP